MSRECLHPEHKRAWCIPRHLLNAGICRMEYECECGEIYLGDVIVLSDHEIEEARQWEQRVSGFRDAFPDRTASEILEVAMSAVRGAS